MARPETPGTESERAIQNEIARHKDAAEIELSAASAEESDAPTRRYLRTSAAERDRRVQEIRNTDFPIGLRGYERAAVDRYVTRVNRLIAELEISSSPESAVRHALEEVSEETRDLLQRAHQTSEEITARSRAKAEERMTQAKAEVAEILAEARREAGEIREHAQREAERLRDTTEHDAARLREQTASEVTQLREQTTKEMTELRDTTVRDVQQLRASAKREADELRASAKCDADEMLESAEARVRDLSLSAETLWRERRRLIEDMRGVGEQLVTIAEAEAKRFPRFENGGPPEHRQTPAQPASQQPAAAS
jgi:DivIVA domain-containing protein